MTHAAFTTGVRHAAMSAALLLTAILGLAACAPSADEGAPPQSEAPPPDDGSTDAGDDTEDDADDAGGDDLIDPTQETRRSGLAAEHGGPPYGDQGVFQVSEGRWCSVVGFFWGEQPPPENAVFTIDGIVSSPDGALTAEGSDCAGLETPRDCIGLTVTPEDDFVECSMLLIEEAAFEPGATVRFVGTLECTEPRFCDAAIAREVTPGPPIVVPGG